MQLSLDAGRRRAGRHEAAFDKAVRAARRRDLVDALDAPLVTTLRALYRELDTCEASGKVGTGAYVARTIVETLQALRLTRDTRTDLDSDTDPLLDLLALNDGPAPARDAAGS